MLIPAGHAAASRPMCSGRPASCRRACGFRIRAPRPIAAGAKGERSIRAEKIDLGVCNDETPRQKGRKIAHDLQRDLRVKPAVVGKRVERQLQAFDRGISPDIGTALALEYRHLAKFHARSERSKAYTARQLNADHA